MDDNSINQQMPRRWMTAAILVSIFCLLPLPFGVPFGILGIVHASKVESRFNAGNIEGAKEASRDAGKWVKLGFGVGLAFWVTYAVVIFALIIAGEVL